MSANWRVHDLIQNRWGVYDVLRGGMGVVYVVYDHEMRGLLAAKTFRDEVFALNPIAAERFRKEAIMWVNLDLHLNVTEALFVENVEGRPLLFLEYVGGGNLSALIG